MELKELTFKSDQDCCVSEVDTVTVKMTVKEALWITLVSGRQRGQSPHNSIYDCLACELFNRFWDDGVNDAQIDYNVQIPPIKYED